MSNVKGKNKSKARGGKKKRAQKPGPSRPPGQGQSRKAARRRANRNVAPVRSMVPAVKGKGAYYDANGTRQRGLPPNYWGDVGEKLWNGASSIAEWAGFGAYNVRQNSFSGALMAGNSPAIMANSGNGTGNTIITHREYVGELTTGALAAGSTGFVLTKYTINPGNRALFPWLASIALNYQFYRVCGMILELKSESSSYAAQLSMGTMFMATNYNSLDDAPSDKFELLNMEFSTSGRPCDDQIHLIECAHPETVQTKLYVTGDSNYKGGDARLYNLGDVYIGTFGCPNANQKVAEIWVTYQMELFRPIPASINDDDTTAIWNVDTVGSGFFWGADAVLVAQSATNYQIFLDSDGVGIQLPNVAGAYIYTFVCATPVTAPVTGIGRSVVATATNNCRLVPLYPTPSGNTGLLRAWDSVTLIGSVWIFQVVIIADNVVPVGQVINVGFNGTFSTAAPNTFGRHYISALDYDMIHSLPES